MSLDLTTHDDLTDTDTSIAISTVHVADTVSATTPPSGVDNAALTRAEPVIRAALAALETADKHTAECRVALGRALIPARKAYPSRGPSAAGWSKYLEMWGLTVRTAHRYMALAGYAESTGAARPTYRQAGVKRAPTVVPHAAPPAPPALALVPPPKYDDALEEFVVGGTRDRLVALAHTSPAAQRQVLDALADTARLVQEVVS